ncbi:MAG: hypothetical protein ACE5GW_02095, partial [Planctomycetota bacterium]
MARRLSLPIVLGFLIALAVASAASHDLLAQGQASYIFLLSDTSPTRTENGWEPNELLQVVGKEVESTGWVVPLPAGVHVDALTAGRDDGDTLHTILLFTVTPVGGEMHAFAKSDLAREPAVEAASDLFGLAFHSGFDLDRQLSHRKAVDENGDPKPVFV